MTNGDNFTVKEVVLRIEEKVDEILEDHERRLRDHTRRLDKLDLNALLARVAVPVVGLLATAAVTIQALHL